MRVSKVFHNQFYDRFDLNRHCVVGFHIVQLGKTCLASGSNNCCACVNYLVMFGPGIFKSLFSHI